MDWLHEYFLTPINVLLGVRAAIDIVFSVVFWFVAVKTAWEIRRYKKNGLMIKIKRLAQSSASKFIATGILSLNGILTRVISGYPPEATFFLLCFDIGISIWLATAMYRLADDLMMEGSDDDDLPNSPETQESSGHNLPGNS